MLGILIATIVRLHLTADRDILAVNQGSDDLWQIRAAYEGLWKGAYWHMKAAHLPIYALWLQTNAYLGIPARLAFDLLWCGSSLLLAWSFARLSRSIAAGILVFLFLLFHPAGITLADRALAENILPPLVAICLALGMELWLARHRRGLVRGLLLLGFALACGISYQVRREGFAFLPPFLMLVIAWLVRSSWRPHRLPISLVLAPAIAIAALGSYLVARNAYHWGFASRCELLAPGYSAALQALYAIQPDTPNPVYVTVTRATRQHAYEVSPTFRELQPILEGQLAQQAAQVDYGIGTALGEIPDGWFYWDLREAAARTGWHRDARTAEAKYQAVATEIRAALERGDLAKRPVLTVALSPEYQRWIPLLPEASWRALCMFLDLATTGLNRTNRDLPEDALAMDVPRYIAVTGRRQAAGKFSCAVQGWINAPAGATLALGPNPDNWTLLSGQTPEAENRPFRLHRNSSVKPEFLILALPTGGRSEIPLSALHENTVSFFATDHRPIGIDVLLQETRNLRASRFLDRSIHLWTWLSWTAAVGGAICLPLLLVCRIPRRRILAGLIVVAWALIAARVVLNGAIDLAAWPGQYRYMVAALPALALLLGCVVHQCSLHIGGAISRALCRLRAPRS